MESRERTAFVMRLNVEESGGEAWRAEERCEGQRRVEECGGERRRRER